MGDRVRCVGDERKITETDSTELSAMDGIVKLKKDNASEDAEDEGVGRAREMQTGTTSEMYVYRQDIVKCINRPDLLGPGVVLQVAGDDSDSESSIMDSSDIDDDAVDSEHGNEGKEGDSGGDSTKGEGNTNDKKDPLSDGEIRTMWLDGTETRNNLSDLVVLDRRFLQGNIVASAANPSGQLGLVVDVHVTVDLLSLNRNLIKGVSSSELKCIRKFAVGDYVVQGSWLGRVEDVLDNVTVLFDDGSACKVLMADPLRLKPLHRSIVDDTTFPYYPGQRVRASSSSIFKKCRFLSGSWKANRLEATVNKVEAGSVFVYWTSSSSIGTGADEMTIPPQQQNPKNLTSVSCFAHSDWQLGEWCLFSPNPEASPSSVNSSKTIDSSLDVCNSSDAIFKNVVVNQSESAVANSADSMICNLAIHDRRELIQGEDCEADEIQHASTWDKLYVHTVVDCSADSLHGERCNPAEIDNCSSGQQKESTRETRPVHRKKLRKAVVKRDHRGSIKDDSFEKAFLIVNINTTVDVAWQDGTRELGLKSNSLIPINSPGEQDFFPEQYVIEKASVEVDDSSEMRRVGVVRSVNATERTASVKWLKPVSRPEDPRQFDIEEVVSVYELDEHPDYDYCYGDVVIRLAPMVVSAGNTSSANFPPEGKDHVVQTPENGENDRSSNFIAEVPPKEDTKNVKDLSWVGHVTGLHDGDIEVAWADGTISKVGPQAIFVVDHDDDETLDGDGEYSDGASWETVEENDTDTIGIAEEGPALVPQTDEMAGKGGENSKDVKDAAAERNGPLSSALGFVARLASGFFSRGQIQENPQVSETEESMVGLRVLSSLAASEISTELGNPNFPSAITMDDHGSQVNDASSTGGCSPVPENTCAEMTTSINNIQEHALSNSDSGIIETNGDSFKFKHFDIAQDSLDHYFLGGSGQVVGEKKWAKKVQQEWSVLQKNLPDAIYVRVFEDRMDLLRAAIIGACGTPYQDGLFFFDFQLPPEYPEFPPKTYYHSGGLRINPNLYEDGKVCLSLLNTWTGKGNEVWDPSSSSILQVLVSIQGLVLNSKPYFNEAGYEKQIGTVEGEKNSLPYNENIFLLNLKSMMYILRRPPVCFEEFTKAHFRRRGRYILKACDAYMKGAAVGSLTKDADAAEENDKHSCSCGFRLMLAKILPRLITVLKEVGAQCDQYEHLVSSSS